MTPSANPAGIDFQAQFDRREEMTRLRERFRARGNLLIFGPEGVGKTRLLRSFIATEPHALYVEHASSPRNLLVSLLEGIQSRSQIAKPAGMIGLSSSSLKGVVHKEMDAGPFFMVIDQVAAPSKVVTGIIKDLSYYGRTPVVFASRSPHMEDIGGLRGLCTAKAERLEMANWLLPVALEFARQQAKRLNVTASNLDSILPSLVSWSDGNPGAIMAMLRMATKPQYLVGDQIKAHVLYLDFRMGRR